MLTWNAGAERLYGFSAAEIIGQPSTITEPPERRGEMKDAIEKLFAGGEGFDYETVRLRKDGTAMDAAIALSPIKAEDGSLVAISAFIRDITARKRSEQMLRNTTRALDMLSRANEVVVRATTEESLYQQMCQVIVEDGGYAMAWIGLAEDDADKTVRPVAYEGHEDDYLQQARITWADTERGRGPTGSAIREGAVQISHNTADDPRMAPWRDHVRKRGFAASIAFALRDSARVFGSLTIYSRDPDFFGPDEVALLSRLADNLSYGAAALKARSEREVAARKFEQAKEKAEHAEALLQDAIDTIAEGFVICDANGRQIVCNESFRRLYRYQTGTPWAPGVTRQEGLRRNLASRMYTERPAVIRSGLKNWRDGTGRCRHGWNGHWRMADGCW